MFENSKTLIGEKLNNLILKKSVEMNLSKLPNGKRSGS